ncbi:MAG TPA: cytochrome C assembly protein, partial [Anaeromyxobacter sp.]
MSQLKRYAPWIAGVLALAGAALSLVPARPVRGFDLDAFGRLPVLEGGRVKPIDSIARNSLMVIRGAQSFQHEGRTIGPEEWLLDVLFRPELADAEPTFQIDDPDVLGLIGLPQTSQRRFPFTALVPYLGQIEQQA